MASCSKHKGGRCSCSAPASVAVGGHWRELTGRRKKKRAPAKPKSPYYVAESGGATCGHHHRTRAGARRCATAHQRKESANRARYLNRKQARKTRVKRWDVELVKP